MSKRNKYKQVPFRPPIRTPAPLDVTKMLESKVQEIEEKIRLEAANRGLNLAVSALIITLHDKFGFNKERLERALEYSFNHMECAMAGYVTYEEMMQLCTGFGLTAHDIDLSKIEKSIEEIHQQFKNYEEMKEYMAKKDQALNLFEQGASIQDIMDKLGVSKAMAYNYQKEWKGAKNRPSSADELADAIFGKDPEEQETNATNSEVKTPQDEQTAIPKKWLVEKSKTVTYQGEYGTYKVTNELVDVKLETAEMGLDKKTLIGLIEELQEVYESI